MTNFKENEHTLTLGNTVTFVDWKKFFHSARRRKIAGFRLIIIDLKLTYFSCTYCLTFSRFLIFVSLDFALLSSASGAAIAFSAPISILRNQKRFRKSRQAGRRSQKMHNESGTLKIKLKTHLIIERYQGMI